MLKSRNSAFFSAGTVVHTNELTCITSNQIISKTDLEKNWEKPTEEVCFFRSNFLPPLCPKEWRLRVTTKLVLRWWSRDIPSSWTSKNFDNQAQQEAEYSQGTVTKIGKETSGNYIMPGVCKTLTSEAQIKVWGSWSSITPTELKNIYFQGSTECEHLKQQSG